MEINDVIEGEILSTKVRAEATEISRPTITLTNLGLTKLLNDGTPNFNKIATTDEGIFQTEDDSGISYYFRGASENNYVYFAGFYWRIIRINGDGSIRIIYDGISTHVNGEVSEDRQVKRVNYYKLVGSGDNAYVGYMYGKSGSSTYEETHTNVNDSTIKTANDSWYKTNIEDKGYSGYIIDAIYCNDRSIYTGTGIGNSNTFYNCLNRLEKIKTPTLICNLDNDKFSVSILLGNGDLKYPVGLITADEVMFGGASNLQENKLFYLFTGNEYWTMSPSSFEEGVLPSVWWFDDFGRAFHNNVNYSLGLRPVISLKYGLSYTGDGSINNPFKIIEN